MQCSLSNNSGNNEFSIVFCFKAYYFKIVFGYIKSSIVYYNVGVIDISISSVLLLLLLVLL